MKTYDNGGVAVTIEYERATVRIIDHVPSSERAPYVGIGQLTRLPRGAALLSGFSGQITRAHCWLLLNALLNDGFTVAYMDRLEGHVGPFAERVTEGDFAGLWRVDLSRMCDRRRPRKSAPAAAEATS